jgi:hypothetical protein
MRVDEIDRSGLASGAIDFIYFIDFICGSLSQLIVWSA